MEPPKGSKWPAEGPHYAWGTTSSNLLGSAWMLDVEPGTMIVGKCVIQYFSNENYSLIV